MTRILLTGFDPFAGAPSNPSRDAVALVASRWTRPEDLVTSILPVEFEAAGATVTALIAEHGPDLVVAVGLADGRTAISVERVAINVDDARIPDNGGAQPIDRPIDPDGPAAWFSSLPIKAMGAGIRDAGIPVAVSQTAGTYVCNRVFYEVMRALDGTKARGGFVHVPSADVVSIENQARALEIALAIALGRTVDAPLVGGAEH